MADEEKKQEEPKSKKLQITFNTSFIKNMEERAEQIGLTLNQYFTYVVAKDMDNFLLYPNGKSEKVEKE